MLAKTLFCLFVIYVLHVAVVFEKMLFLIGPVFNPRQRCGYSGSPFAGMYFFYTAGSRNGFHGMEPVGSRTQNQKTL